MWVIIAKQLIWRRRFLLQPSVVLVHGISRPANPYPFWGRSTPFSKIYPVYPYYDWLCYCRYKGTCTWEQRKRHNSERCKNLERKNVFWDIHILTFQLEFELSSTNSVGCSDDRYIHIVTYFLYVFKCKKAGSNNDILNIHF